MKTMGPIKVSQDEWSLFCEGATSHEFGLKLRGRTGAVLVFVGAGNPDLAQTMELRQNRTETVGGELLENQNVYVIASSSEDIAVDGYCIEREL